MKVHYLFSDKIRHLVIPVYQRKYAWSVVECDRLFDDIEELVNTGHPSHFFGAIVGKADNKDWQIIDGQQRLTTVSLLMLALVHAIKDREIECSDEGLTQEIYDTYLMVESSGSSVMRLKPIEQDAAAYTMLFEQDPELPEESNVVRNYRQFRKRLQKCTLTAEQVWEQGITKLEVMYLDLEEHDHPQQIFETLNSTGVKLAEADKIRNFVLMDVPATVQEDLYKNYWLKIESCVGAEADSFFRQYLTSKKRVWINKDLVYPEFRAYAKKSELTMQELLADVRDYAGMHKAITTAQTGYADVDAVLRRANLILGDLPLPLLWNVLRDTRDGVIDGQDLYGVITTIESYLFRRAVANIGSNALSAIFAPLYAEIRKRHEPGLTYTNILAYLLLSRAGASGRFPTNEEFRSAFLTCNFYAGRKIGFRRYFFDKLENGHSKDIHDIATAMSTDSVSIEHVMPQTLTPAWREMLGPNAEEVHQKYLHTIGNLTISAYNSSYSNKPFAEKLSMENGLRSTPYRLNAMIIDCARWDEKAIVARAKHLADLALDYWPMITTTFTPPPAPQDREPLGDEGNFRSRSITAFELNGESTPVDSWTDMTEFVLTSLVREHHDQLFTLCTQVSTLVNKDEPFLKPEDNYRKFSPDMWVYVNNSTPRKIELLRRVFDALDLDPYQLVFVMKPLKDSDAKAQGKEKRYAGVTKFLHALEKMAGSPANETTLADFSSDFFAACAAHPVENSAQLLEGKKLKQFLTSADLGTVSAEQIFALFAQAKDVMELTGDESITDVIPMDKLHAALVRLEELG